MILKLAARPVSLAPEGVRCAAGRRPDQVIGCLQAVAGPVATSPVREAISTRS
jgi:hypothetical protein